MGTLYKQDPGFFKTCFRAFANKDYQVILSVGSYVKMEELGDIPKNFFVKNYVPQLKVLEITNVFISHAGMGGINEAMFYNVPMLLLPKTVEQQVNAHRIAALGAGIDLRSQGATAEQLQEYTEVLLKNSTYKQATTKICQSFKDAGGLDHVIKAIEALL